ncbi:hypothetical protein [Streptomyces sp. MMG1121]|uniref:hypothetical protein n=1 Tax=Streptomyces sp. MMG1121 TaxID=1415544 RepID=UPI0006C0BC8C|nr:hypothetical protein [Streptomyces sp. MMG1121]KOV59358.1 hypothetical protein ADK64_34135 [Streptomyces sp. MMG1121]
MRLCTSLSPCLAAAALSVLVPVSPDAAHADAAVACAGADAHAFPLATRIRGGPGSYVAGGGYGTWYIDLTNTTRRTCTGIHPVVVLVDDKRALQPGQPRLDFYDGPRARPVSFESTDEQELVGVLDGAGFDGFAVPPGKTVSVRVRLSLTSDAVVERVTASAAVVQRRGGNGEWVGESGPYRFGIGREGRDGVVVLPEPEATPEREGTQAPGGTPAPGGTQGGGSAPPRSPGSPQAAPGAGTATGVPTSASSFPSSASPLPSSLPASVLPFAQEVAEVAEVAEAGSRARELARTGLGLAHGLFAAAAALLGVGGGAFVLARRRP